VRVQVGEERHLLAHGQLREQAGGLQLHAEPGADLARLGAALLPQHAQRAPVRLAQAKQAFDRGRLARAVRPSRPKISPAATVKLIPSTAMAAP